ncbi:GTPase [Chloroflexota bacterium]
MPANLPPQYFEAEKTYRLAKTPDGKVEALETMLAIMPKHKGTDKLRAELRRRIAKHLEEAERRPAGARTGGSFNIRREGVGQIVLVGLPNSGKSELVSALTGTLLEAADYPYTTKAPTPVMLMFENIQIQLVDMPPITDRDAKPWFSHLFRNADALMIVVDLEIDPVTQMETIIAELDKMMVKLLGKVGGEEDLLPGFVRKKALIVANKYDLDYSAENCERLNSEYSDEFHIIPASAKKETELRVVSGGIYEFLGIVRVYTKSPGKKPDFEDPIVLKKGSTIEDAAESVHKDFRNKLKYVQMWGSGKFDGQRVSRGHVLEDGDVVELHV